jgi:hypothetical protein
MNGMKENMSASPSRRRNRSTILTTSRALFMRVSKLSEGQSFVIECPNDIISTARNGQDNVHHSVRRVELIRRALRGGFRAVRVRYEQGFDVKCLIDGDPVGNEDAASFRVKVVRVS